jgi:glycine cleavage system regulatory protein
MKEFQIDLNHIEGQIINRLRGANLHIKRYENLGDIDVSNGNIVVTSTFCPLYTHGSLEESALITPPATIEDSRVSGKWEAALQVFNGINKITQEQGLSVHGIFTFADAGVIVAQESDLDQGVLQYHENLYQNGIDTQMGGFGLTYDFQCYSDLIPDFPAVFRSRNNRDIESYPKLATEIARELGNDVIFAKSVINDETGTINRSGKKIIVSMLKTLGPDLTIGLLRQYGSFDAMTTKEGALNVFYERGQLLLNVTNLFEHKRNPRLDIVC